MKITFYISSLIIFSTCFLPGCSDVIKSSEALEDMDQIILPSTNSQPRNGSNTGGTTLNHATYPLPTGTLYSAPDFSNLTLGQGETGDAEVGMRSPIDYQHNLYLILKSVELIIEIEGVNQPAQKWEPNKFFPKSKYVTAEEDKIQETQSGDSKEGNSQRIFYFKCDTSKGKEYRMTMTYYYTKRTRNESGNETDAEQAFVMRSQYTCDGSNTGSPYRDFKFWEYRNPTL